MVLQNKRDFFFLFFFFRLKEYEEISEKKYEMFAVGEERKVDKDKRSRMGKFSFQVLMDTSTSRQTHRGTTGTERGKTNPLQFRLLKEIYKRGPLSLLSLVPF